MAAPGFTYLTQEQVRVLRNIEAGLGARKYLAELLDNALTLVASEMPTDIPQANVDGLVSALASKLTAAKLVKYTSSAITGGAATETVTFTGLAVADTVLAVTQKTKGANSLPLLGWGNQALNALDLTWSAAAGAGCVVEALVLKA